MTFRLKSHNSTDLAGFINTLTANGYQVTFREGGNHNILMADVDDNSCKIRNAVSCKAETTETRVVTYEEHSPEGDI